MAIETKIRNYDVKTLPIQEDVTRFAPEYFPEKFTEEEKYYVECFWTNLDKPVFIAKNMPEEISAALASRYSRAKFSARRLFLEEYVKPILYPELQDDWDKKSDDDKNKARHLTQEFQTYVWYLHEHGGLDKVVNVQRAQAFFEKWLDGFGDDSIAELGGVHVFVEGASNVAVNEMQKKRIGVSPLEKSSRYVSFAEQLVDKESGQKIWQYVVPGEILGTADEQVFREAMDELFETYTRLHTPYLDYIKQRYPKGEDETNGSFNNSRSAKRFDDIRDLLPFATRTNVGMFGNGRAFEDLINRMVDHELGEVRYWGQMICREMEQVVPSFVVRPKKERGGENQRYRRNIKTLAAELAGRLLEGILPKGEKGEKAKLLRYTPNAEAEVLAAYLFPGEKQTQFTLEEIREAVYAMTPNERKEYFEKIFEERKFGKTAPEETTRDKVRFRKVPRAFEVAHYLFQFFSRGGDFRDLHRHRMCTQDRTNFTCNWGFEIEKEVAESPFAKEFVAALKHAEGVFKQLEPISPDVAQYAVPFAYLQQWYMELSAREIYWMVELRTGPQGRDEYRKVCQKVASIVKKVNPRLFRGLMVDNNDYRLSRRESEKKKDQKKIQLS